MVSFCFIQPPSSKYNYKPKKCRICGKEFKPSSGVQNVCFDEDCKHQIKLEKWRKKNQIHMEDIYKKNLQRYHHKKEKYQIETKQCDCGCKTIIPKYTAKGKPNKFYKGHYWKGKKMPEWICEKWSERQLKLMQNEEYIKKRLKLLIAKPNRLESRIISVVEKYNLGLEYVGNGEYFIDRFNPDFINIEKKKVLEIFGDYWHNLDTAIKKDKYRKEVYNKHGFDLMILWENEIRNMTDDVIHYYINSFLSKEVMH